MTKNPVRGSVCTGVDTGAAAPETDLALRPRRARLGRADPGRQGIALGAQAMDERRRMIGRAGDEQPAGGLGIGEELQPPVGQALGQRHLRAIARPVPGRGAGGEARLRQRRDHRQGRIA